MYGEMSNINAFALGARFVNPKAKIYLEWSCVKNNDYKKKFEEQGIKVISDRDMITPQCSTRKFGLYYVTSQNHTQHLAMPVWHWGVFYEKLIQSVMSGSWNKEEDEDNIKALNYWWGMSAGVIDVIYSSKLPTETKRIVNVFKDIISKGDFELFEGELYDQNGVQKNKEGNVLTPEQIITMNWLLENVIGEVPTTDIMEDDAENIIKAQGII